MEKDWFILIFRKVLETKNWLIKWNVDSELVLHTVDLQKEYDNAVIVSGDWDFFCLVEYLLKKDKLRNLVVPNKFKYSALFKEKVILNYILYINDLKNKLQKR